METRLYVGNLPFSATDDELKQAFSAHGTVTDVALISDRVTGRSRGFAFVTMSTPEERTQRLPVCTAKITLVAASP